MKKVILLSLVCGIIMSFGINLSAVEAGIKGGVNIASLNFSENLPDMDISSYTAYRAGIFCAIDITDDIALQPELYYVMNGATGTASNGIKGKWKLGYLEMPLLLKYNFPGKGKVKPGIYAGPFLAFNLSAKQVVTDFTDENEDIKDQVESLDYGLVFGASVQLELGSGSLIFDARYNLGMKNIGKGDLNDVDFNEVTVKNSSIGLMIGYSF